MSVDLVIFDFDGTLVDTAPDLIRATNRYLTGKGFEPLPEARIRAEIGMGLRRLIMDLYPKHELTDALRDSIEREFTSIYDDEFLKTPRFFEGAQEFLCDWDGPIAIVSNKRTRFIHPILRQLQAHNLPWVRVTGGDSFVNMKPHPEPFLDAIAAAGATPESTVIIGDGAPDVQGALAIGSPCLAVEFGYTDVDELMDLGATAKLESFSELAVLLKQLT